MEPLGAPAPPSSPPPTLVGTLQPPPPPPPPPSPARPAGRGPEILLSVLTVLLGCWIVAVVAGGQTVTWFVEQALIAGLDRPVSAAVWPIVALVTTLVVAGPAALLTLIARSVAPNALGVRASLRGWIIAGVCGGLLGLIRGVQVQHNELTLLLTAVMAALLGWGVRILNRAAPPDAVGPRPTAAGLVIGLAALLPWLWVGALGGLTETVLAAAAAGAIGWLAAGLLSRGFFRGFVRPRGQNTPSRARVILLGGLAGGVALLAIAAGVGGTGSQLPQLLVLPALGFAVAALVTRPWPALGPGATTLMVGLTAFGPLAFTDPEEISILLGTDGRWALIGALLTMVIALVAGTAYPLILNLARDLSRPLGLGLAVALVVASAGVYTLAGQPGLHGERLFVILKQQADLSGIAQIPNRATRLRTTYQRLVETATSSQAPLRRSLDRFHLSYTPYYLVNAVSVDGGPAVRQWLAGRSDVDRILLEENLRPLPAETATAHGTAATPNGDPQWNIKLIEADKAWRQLGATGAGITIGTSDSGVDGAHPALREGFRGGDDSWFDPWNGTTAPVDHGGHGTHTLGSALGRDGIGVAPAAQWIGCVNLDRNLGRPSRYLDCLQFMLAPFPHGGDPLRDGRPERAPHVLTNSWGCPWLEGCDATVFDPALAALRAAGIFVVAAAGNSGLAGCGSVNDPPATSANALTVGAVDRNRRVSDFSSRGPTATGLGKPDVVAPGARVLSAFPGGTYEIADGTSMATPHVAGVIALMWSAQPKLIGDLETTAQILRQTATPVSPPAAGTTAVIRCGGSAANVSGAGIVDAYAAVAAAKNLG